MTLLQAITAAYTLATGKTTMPAAGSTKYTKLTELAKLFYEDIQTEPGIEWDWLYQVVTSAATISASTTYTLSTAIHFVSTAGQRELNRVRVLHTDGETYTYFQLVKPGELHRYRNSYAVAQVSSTQIKFSKAFNATDDACYGGTLEVPAIRKLTALSDPGDTVQPELEKWLTKRTAAGYVQTDRQLNYLYRDKLDEADEQLRGLINRNTAGSDSTSTGVDFVGQMGGVGNTGTGYGDDY